MATIIDRNLCNICRKARGICKCEGCLNVFCHDHFGNHRQELNKQLDGVEVDRDIFRQILNGQTAEPQKHALVQRINDWERDSINKIRQTAEEARRMLLEHTTRHINEIEGKLNTLTDQLKQSRRENDFVETEICQWKEELIRLEDDLVKLSNIGVREDSKPLVSKIYVDVLDGKCIH
jgi:chromosome segregation ATPase